MNLLRHLSAYQERIKEEERIRIAREIHDELGGLLTGIKANLAVAIDKAERMQVTPDPRLLEAVEFADDAIDTVRKVITDLRPSVLDQLGVWAALEWYVGQTEKRTGIACELTIDAGLAELEVNGERSTALFRIVQEALTNVVRHAGATSVTIRAELKEGLILIAVEDNGKGMEESMHEKKGSWGVVGMYERARYFGGDLTIQGRAGCGTAVTLRMPLENTHEQ